MCGKGCVYDSARGDGSPPPIIASSSIPAVPWPVAMSGGGSLKMVPPHHLLLARFLAHSSRSSGVPCFKTRELGFTDGWVGLLAGLSWEKREVAARGSEGYGTLAPIRPPRPPTYIPRASNSVGEHLGTLLCCRRCPPTCIPGWLWNLPKGTPCNDGGRDALCEGPLPGWRAIRMAPTLPPEGKALAVTSLIAPG